MEYQAQGYFVLPSGTQLGDLVENARQLADQLPKGELRGNDSGGLFELEATAMMPVVDFPAQPGRISFRPEDDLRITYTIDKEGPGNYGSLGFYAQSASGWSSAEALTRMSASVFGISMDNLNGARKKPMPTYVVDKPAIPVLTQGIAIGAGQPAGEASLPGSGQTYTPIPSEPEPTSGLPVYGLADPAGQAEPAPVPDRFSESESVDFEVGPEGILPAPLVPIDPGSVGQVLDPMSLEKTMSDSGLWSWWPEAWGWLSDGDRCELVSSSMQPACKAQRARRIKHDLTTFAKRTAIVTGAVGGLVALVWAAKKFRSKR